MRHRVIGSLSCRVELPCLSENGSILHYRVIPWYRCPESHRRRVLDSVQAGFMGRPEVYIRCIYTWLLQTCFRMEFFTPLRYLRPRRVDFFSELRDFSESLPWIGVLFNLKNYGLNGQKSINLYRNMLKGDLYTRILKTDKSGPFQICLKARYLFVETFSILFLLITGIKNLKMVYRLMS